MKKSQQLFERAQQRIPGGVNSPVRAFRAVGGTPPFLERASGAYVWDAEGRRYLDYLGSWGPMVVGHTHPAVVEAVQEAASRAQKNRSGNSWPAPGRKPAASVCQVNSCASRTASGGASPFASAAAIADASVQPDPW